MVPAAIAGAGSRVNAPRTSMLIKTAIPYAALVRGAGTPFLCAMG